METNEYRKAAAGRKWSPRELWIPAMIWMTSLMLVKLLLFDMLCCAQTSWGALTGVRPYVRVVLSSFILTVPTGMFRRKWMQAAVFVATDAVLLCGGPVQTACAGWLLPETAGAVVLPAWGYPLLVLTSLIVVPVALRYPGRPYKARYSIAAICWGGRSWHG